MLRAYGVAFVSLLAGAAFVHAIYKPDLVSFELGRAGGDAQGLVSGLSLHRSRARSLPEQPTQSDARPTPPHRHCPSATSTKDQEEQQEEEAVERDKGESAPSATPARPLDARPPPPNHCALPKNM